MEMRLQHLQPHPLLQGYVAKMWIFESMGRVPVEDMKLIVPNGMVKITIPFKNGVSAQNKEMFQLSKEGNVWICKWPGNYHLSFSTRPIQSFRQ
jgi:hypothetical protein